MRASTTLLIALLTVLVILVVYVAVRDPEWAHSRYWMQNFVESPWAVYNHSNGTFDDSAQIALRRAAGRQNATAGDHFLSAMIITRNILGQEHRPTLDAQGRPTERDLERSQLRREMFDRAQQHFAGALAVMDPRAATRRRGDTAAAAAPTAPRIIDAAIDFAYVGFAEMLANDALLAAEMQAQWGLEGGGEVMVLRPIAAAATRRREEVLNERRAAAAAVGKSAGGARGAAVDHYISLATEHTSDPQNTHDVGVLASLRAVVARLRADQGPAESLPPVGAVGAWLERDGAALSEGRPQLVAHAQAAVARTSRGETAIALGATDEECLRRVWARIGDPRNAGNRSLLLQSLFDNLADCWEHEDLVCVNGRSERILSVLVLLDWDNQNWEIHRFEEHKNEIFRLAGRTIRELAATAAASDDPGERAAGRSYLATNLQEMNAVGEVPEAAAARLAATMREQVGLRVDKYIAAQDPGAIPAYQVDAVRAEALAAVA